MAQWRHLLFDVRTLEPQAELPAVDQVRFGETLNSAGGFACTISLHQGSSSPLTMDALSPPNAVFAAEKDGELLWAGPIWTHDYDLAAGKVTLAGEGWLSYLHRRIVRDTLTYVQVDQSEIAQDLIDYTQGDTGFPHGVPVGIDTVTYYQAHNRPRDRVYYDYEGKTVGELLEQLGGVRDGFDHRFRPRWTDGPNSTLIVDWLTLYPATGRETDLVFELGSNCDIPRATLDGTSLAYWVRALGKGEGDSAPIQDAQNLDRIAANTLLEAVTTHGDVSELPTLLDYALRRLDRGKSPIVIPGVKVGIDMIGQFAVGDQAIFRADHGIFQVDDNYRVTSYDVDVAAGQVTLTLAQAEVFNVN